jgi:type 1 glutamine amidotransferase
MPPEIAMTYSTFCTTTLLIALAFAAAQAVAGDNANSVSWQGESGPGTGKRIVYLAGDPEYRGEETLPALARILAKEYGCSCTVFFTTDPKDGTIAPGNNNLSGLEVLKDADLLVIFLRFQHFSDDQMKCIDDYLKAGKPVIGLRTATHAFQGLKGAYERFNEGYNGSGEQWKGGFGREILGEHWVGHYGTNHKQSSLLLLEKDQLEHPVLRGVKDVHVQCGGYNADPKPDSVILARGQILNGMAAGDPPAGDKKVLPVAWVRTYQGDKGRVFTTTHGAAPDLLNDGFRRMLVNAHLWCLGLEGAIKADNPISFVGPFHPTTFNFDGQRKGVKPADLAGWDSSIGDAAAPPARP